MHDSCVLAFCGCHTKGLQSKWIKTTHIYYLPVLEVQSPVWVSWGDNPGVSRFLSGDCWGEAFPCLCGCWRNSVPRGCSTEVPLSLLAVSWEPPLPPSASDTCTPSLPLDPSLAAISDSLPCILLPSFKNLCHQFGPTQIIRVIFSSQGI